MTRFSPFRFSATARSPCPQFATNTLGAPSPARSLLPARLAKTHRYFGSCIFDRNRYRFRHPNTQWRQPCQIPPQLGRNPAKSPPPPHKDPLTSFVTAQFTPAFGKTRAPREPSARRPLSFVTRTIRINGNRATATRIPPCCTLKLRTKPVRVSRNGDSRIQQGMHPILDTRRNARDPTALLARILGSLESL